MERPRKSWVGPCASSLCGYYPPGFRAAFPGHQKPARLPGRLPGGAQSLRPERQEAACSPHFPQPATFPAAVPRSPTTLPDRWTGIPVSRPTPEWCFQDPATTGRRFFPGSSVVAWPPPAHPEARELQTPEAARRALLSGPAGHQTEPCRADRRRPLSGSHRSTPGAPDREASSRRSRNRWTVPGPGSDCGDDEGWPTPGARCRARSPGRTF